MSLWYAICHGKYGSVHPSWPYKYQQTLAYFTSGILLKYEHKKVFSILLWPFRTASKYKGVSEHKLTPWLTWNSIIWPWISEYNGNMPTVYAVTTGHHKCPFTRRSNVTVWSVIQFLSMKDIEAITFIVSSWRCSMETMAGQILNLSSNPSMQAHWLCITVCIVQMPISENTDVLSCMWVKHVACMGEKRNAKSI
jgi:hypothetical protein